LRPFCAQSLFKRCHKVEETDLTYEGIETREPRQPFGQGLGSEETDLTYEGIETARRERLKGIRVAREETDLTYEGIETHEGVNLTFRPSEMKKPT